MRDGDEVAVERLIARTGELAREGAEFLLLREKHLGAGELTRLARRVIAQTRQTRMRVIIPGRADMALAAEAPGVHLSSAAGELTPVQVRLVSPRAWVSVSCHSVDEVIRAGQQGADAVLFAPVFGKMVDGTEVVPGAGLQQLRQACQAADEMAVFALGGITTVNAEECLLVGASGVAGMRMFFVQECQHPV